MDATTAPHRIPPEMPQYGETHHIFEMMQNLLEQLLIHQPKDPIQFMIDHLQRNNDHVPKIVILGPPASGKTTIAMWLAKHLKTNLLTVESLLAMGHSELAQEARRHYARKRSVPSMLLVRLVQERLSDEDCISRGWILDGIPETREQAMMVQTLGITPRHVIALSAPDTVLIERNLGKRIDPQTGEIYHTTFDWPPEAEIQNRLVVPEGISEPETVQRLLRHHRNIVRVLPSYPGILKAISADQPCVDVFYQALTYVQTNRRSNAPFTPRVLLCGPVGSGKSLQAGLLAQKYGLVNVCCGQLLKEAVADKSRQGEAIQPFFEKEMTGRPCVRAPRGLWGKPDPGEGGGQGAHRAPGGSAVGARVMFSPACTPFKAGALRVALDSNLHPFWCRRLKLSWGGDFHRRTRPCPSAQHLARVGVQPGPAGEQFSKKTSWRYVQCAEEFESQGQAQGLTPVPDPRRVREFLHEGKVKPRPEALPR
ncbi:hypothetical protein QTO34_005027 [Cnephaeus nilssonii]|uniref:Adenylate kinase 8 n=1 Tax=Cnephaeus nilssonii TaxID=3371016 RepID=A0AA40HMV1_CNENI|nr:hypothetical protein QTO34_005027 [Eptesicus nilssonii]